MELLGNIATQHHRTLDGRIKKSGKDKDLSLYRAPDAATGPSPGPVITENQPSEGHEKTGESGPQSRHGDYYSHSAQLCKAKEELAQLKEQLATERNERDAHAKKLQQRLDRADDSIRLTWETARKHEAMRMTAEMEFKYRVNGEKERYVKALREVNRQRENDQREQNNYRDLQAAIDLLLGDLEHKRQLGKERSLNFVKIEEDMLALKAMLDSSERVNEGLRDSLDKTESSCKSMEQELEWIRKRQADSEVPTYNTGVENHGRQRPRDADEHPPPRRKQSRRFPVAMSNTRYDDILGACKLYSETENWEQQLKEKFPDTSGRARHFAPGGLQRKRSPPPSSWPTTNDPSICRQATGGGVVIVQAFYDTGNHVGPLISLRKLLELEYTMDHVNKSDSFPFIGAGGGVHTEGSITLRYSKTPGGHDGSAEHKLFEFHVWDDRVGLADIMFGAFEDRGYGLLEGGRPSLMMFCRSRKKSSVRV